LWSFEDFSVLARGRIGLGGLLVFCYVAVKEEAEEAEIRKKDYEGRLDGIPSSIAGGDYYR
jgi:hypothetical protein